MCKNFVSVFVDETICQIIFLSENVQIKSYVDCNIIKLIILCGVFVRNSPVLRPSQVYLQTEKGGHDNRS